MKNRLTQYVDLLFAGTAGTEEMKQEILQNTLDRYDDLVAQGKSPEAAYSLAIAGIGDITEILGHAAQTEQKCAAAEASRSPEEKKKMRAVAIGMYICCVVPVIALGNIGDGILGVCLMFLMIAAATVLIIMSSDGKREVRHGSEGHEPQHPAYKLIDSIFTVVMFVLYFGLSFQTGAWHITWLIFPIFACVDGIVKAVFDLLEGKK